MRANRLHCVRRKRGTVPHNPSPRPDRHSTIVRSSARTPRLPSAATARWPGSWRSGSTPPRSRRTDRLAADRDVQSLGPITHVGLALRLTLVGGSEHRLGGGGTGRPLPEIPPVGGER